MNTVSATLLEELGARYLVLIDDTYTDLFTGERTGTPRLKGEEWKRLVEGANLLGRLALERFGLLLTFHPHAETHVAGLRGNLEFFQKPGKVRVRPLVVNDEPGIDGVCPAVQRDRNSMGMSADVIVGLEDSHFMCCAEQVGGEHAGDAGSADRNFHSSCGPEQSA